MKILICSKLFYPSNKIGAVRPSNFAKYLAKFGHEVTVVTEKTNPEQNFNLEGVEIIRVSNSVFIENLIDKNTKRVTSKKTKEKSTQDSLVQNETVGNKVIPKLKNELIKTRRQIFSLVIEFDWFLTAKKHINKHYKYNHFDVVISSFGPLSSFLLGKSIAKHGIAKCWISDFRDNMRFDGFPRWLNKLMEHYEKRALKHADALTFVSHGQKAMFLNNIGVGDEQKQKIHTIHNGYEEKLNTSDSIKTNNSVLKIAYTGQLYSGVRDFTLLFHVLDDLIKEKKIDINKIRIEYAGQNSNELNIQMSKFENIKSICTDYGFVPREKALEIQKESDILVALTWNTTKEQGILTGKFLEYLQTQKTIIALTTGDLPNGEMTQMVQDLKIGIACEYFSYQTDYLKLKAYIEKQYKLFIAEGELNFSPKYEKISEFHYENISKQLMKVINSTTQKA